jgi:outer membrane protein OmpA-like peptidoglycan-associated protein
MKLSSRGTTVLVIISILFIFGCGRQRQQNAYTPLSFDAAIKLIANNIFSQEVKKIGPFRTKAVFVVDQIIDTDTGEVTKTNKRIGELVADEGRRSFPEFSVYEMSSDNLKKADYVIAGVITQELYERTKKKLPHLSLSVVDVKTGLIASRSDVWISNDNLSYEPTPMYKDSPMYIKDQRVQALIATAKAEAGSIANKEYFNSLQTNALLDEASNAYDTGNYTLSLGLFAQAAERNDGKIMKTFSGLYQNFLKLGQVEKAEQAFATLTEIGMQNHNLSVKFLFRVNDTEFSGTPNDLNGYSIWVRQIAQRIHNSENCVQIVGHASKSGTDEYNKKLSLRRAQSIQSRLEAGTSGIAAKTRSFGRGFDENIIGSGANDDSDAIDRRVEFKVVRCENLSTSK